MRISGCLEFICPDGSGVRSDSAWSTGRFHLSWIQEGRNKVEARPKGALEPPHPLMRPGSPEEQETRGTALRQEHKIHKEEQHNKAKKKHPNIVVDIAHLEAYATDRTSLRPLVWFQKQERTEFELRDYRRLFHSKPNPSHLRPHV